MSDKQVVRQDVVEIRYDVDNNPLLQLAKETNEFQSSMTKAFKGDQFDSFNSGAKKAADGLDDIKDNAVKASGSTEDVADVSFNPVVSGLKKVSDKLGDVATKATGAAFNGLKKVAGVTFKATAAGLGVAVAGVSALVTSAVKSYADTEQLQGGVETLFGAGGQSIQEYAKSVNKSVGEVKQEYKTLMSAQKEVFRDANDAYKTAGLSANEYMETVTGFSASLVSSLKGDKKAAAKLSKEAVVDMADNANKMGTPVENIQNAYQGFAKQNYTMLDNLKLGYGGTKSEMERLIKDAAKLDKSVDANSLSFDNIVKAIHAVQGNLGITGTTAKEASQTISGSLGALKSAWGNFQSALVSGGDDLDQCVDNLVDAAITFSKNAFPAIKKALGGVGRFVKEVVPQIVKQIPPLAADILPSLATAGAQIVVGFGQSLIQNAPVLASAAQKLIISIVKAFYKGFTGKEMSGEQLNTLKQTISTVFTSIKNIVVGTVNFIKQVFTALAPILLWIGGIALNVFSWIGDNINWLLPIVGGIIAAFLAYKAVMVVVNAISAVVAAGQAIMATVTGTASATTAAGTAAVGSAAGASAPQILAFAAAILAVGVSILAICVGFYLLATAAINLANAGWGAIAVMGAMILVIVGLAIGLAVLAPVLTAGSVGLLAFGACVALVGAGFMMLGAGALMAAMGLQIVIGCLPALIQNGLAGSMAIILLGTALIVFAAGAALAGLAALGLGAGLMVVAAALLVMAVSITLITLNFMLLSALSTVLALSFAVVALCFLSMISSALLLSVALLPLIGTFAALSIPTLLFVATITPLAAMFAVLAASALIFLASLVGVLAVFTALIAMSMLFVVTLYLINAGLGIMGAMARITATAIMPLIPAFMALVAPAAALLAAIAPLAVMFTLLAASSVVFLLAITGVFAIITLLAVTMTMLNVQLMLLSVLFNIVGQAVGVFLTAIAPLGAVAMSLIPPVLSFTLAITPLTLLFVALAASALIFTVSLVALLAIVTVLTVILTVMTATLMLLPVTMLMIATFALLMAQSFTMLIPCVTAIAPLLLILSAALLPLTGVFMAVMVSALIFTATMAGLMAVMVVLAPMALIFALAMAMLPPLFDILSWLPAGVASSLSGLIGTFSGLIAPTVSLIATVTPLVALFTLFAVSSAALLVVMVGLLAVTAGIGASLLFMTITGRLLSSTFGSIIPVIAFLCMAFRSLLPVLSEMTAPTVKTTAGFVLLAMGLSVSFNKALGLYMGMLLLRSAILSTARSTTLFAMVALVLAKSFRSMNNERKTFTKTITQLPQSFKVVFVSAALIIALQLAKIIAVFRNSSSNIQAVLRALCVRILAIFAGVSLYSTGVNIMLGLNQGLLNTESTVLSTAKRVATNIKDTINKTLKINSPSGVTEESGYFTGMGSVVGMEKSIPKVQTASANVGQAMYEGIGYSTGGYSPDNSTTTTTTNNTQNKVYKPQFVININGSTDRATEGKFRQIITEVMDDLFADMDDYAYMEV